LTSAQILQMNFQSESLVKFSAFRMVRGSIFTIGITQSNKDSKVETKQNER
jgi:hypothetical protein